MRYMMMIKATRDYETGAPPKEAVMAGMAQLSQEMAEAGVLLLSAGLQPSAQGALLRCTDGKLTVLDGPFAETKELIGGFAILEAKSKREAIELAKRAVDVHTKAGVDIELEVRPLFDPPSGAPGR
jgi:hypothetical protein